MVEIEMRDGVGVLRLAHGKVNALDLELLNRSARNSTASRHPTPPPSS